MSEPKESDLKEERTMNRKVFNSGELLNYMLPKLNMLLDIAIRRIWSGIYEELGLRTKPLLLVLIVHCAAASAVVRLVPADWRLGFGLCKAK